MSTKIKDIVLSYNLSDRKDIALWEAAPELLEAAIIAQLVLFHITPVQVDESFEEGKAALQKAQSLLLKAIAKAKGN